MSKIISIGTALPSYKHSQNKICEFMIDAYSVPEIEKRKIKFLYDHSGIEYRYSVIPDYSKDKGERLFYPISQNLEPFPTIEKRMNWFMVNACPLSIKAIKRCLNGHLKKNEITHLITVSCTGLSAPGLEISIHEALKLSSGIFRTSLNFMGCFGAIHALKIADAFCKSEKNAVVLIVCTELCTLHFQKEYTSDNVTSSLLFGDGSAAVLVTNSNYPADGLHLSNFKSELLIQGKSDMAWHVSSLGFRMTLSRYIPLLIGSGIEPMLKTTLNSLKLKKNKISHWAIHPGGKKILETVKDQLNLTEVNLKTSFNVLKKHGNMSSPTILFILSDMMKELNWREGNRIFAAAFGPGLTMESLILTNKLK